MNDRRDFLKTASAAFTTNIFTGNVRGANGRHVVSFIGMGRMGMSNLNVAMKQDNVEVHSVCDVYEPHLQKAVTATESNAIIIKHFRESIVYKSIDIF